MSSFCHDSKPESFNFPSEFPFLSLRMCLTLTHQPGVLPKSLLLQPSRYALRLHFDLFGRLSEIHRFYSIKSFIHYLIRLTCPREFHHLCQSNLYPHALAFSLVGLYFHILRSLSLLSVSHPDFHVSHRWARWGITVTMLATLKSNHTNI